jgi:tRNA/rRNA methyltransferase
VFGREDRGLRNDELLQAGRLLRIGTTPDYPSLNLSHAVAVVLHEIQSLRASDGSRAGAAEGAEARGHPPAPNGMPWPEPSPRGELEAALADAQDLLLEAGFLHPHTARARMAKLRRVLQRAQTSREEVALIRGMVCQLRWACRHLSRGDDAP